MLFNQYADGSKFILQVNLYAIDQHSSDHLVMTEKEMHAKVHRYADKGSVWTLDIEDQALTCDDGNGSIDCNLKAEVDTTVWEYWNHNYQSGLESVTFTYCTRYNGGHFSFNEDGVADEIVEKLEQATEEIIDHLNDDCDGDGEYCGDEDDATAFIEYVAQRHLGTNTKVTVKFDHHSS